MQIICKTHENSGLKIHILGLQIKCPAFCRQQLCDTSKNGNSFLTVHIFPIIPQRAEGRCARFIARP